MMAPDVDPPAAQPTAQQCEVVGHDIPSMLSTPCGIDSAVHVPPPLAVVTISFEALAQQCDLFGHEMASSELTPDGGVCEDHKLPAVVVERIVPCPTAQQI
jgi:hypothetical protein